MRPLLMLKMRVLMQMYRCKAKAQHAAPREQAQPSHVVTITAAALPHSQQRPKELQSSNEKMEAMNPFSVHFIGYPLVWSDFGSFGPFGRGGTPN